VKGSFRPLVAIVGGAKISDKIKLIDNMIEKVGALPLYIAAMALLCATVLVYGGECLCFGGAFCKVFLGEYHPPSHRRLRM
jgi:hypothetical protein